MDYNIIKQMIKDKIKDIKPLKYEYDLNPGVVFVPAVQIDDWKASYLVIGEKSGFWTCVRTSFQDEKYAGTYDLIDNNIIIETWNAIQIPVESEIKGYKKLSDEIINSVLQIRKAWLSNEIPDSSFNTGKDINSEPNRLLFHESELQANESLQNALLNDIKTFPHVKLWEQTGNTLDITDYFKELNLNGKIYALLGNLSLSLIWETNSSSPPPNVSIREVGSNTFSIVNWETSKENMSCKFLTDVPESAASIILTIEGVEIKLEVLPYVDKNIISQHSPLSLILFYLLNEINVDPKCIIPDDLLDFGFGSLEKKVMEEENLNLKTIEDKIGFLLLVGLFCDGISEIIKLGLFKWVEEKIDKITDFKPENDYQKCTLRLFNWKKEGFKESIKLFYHTNYDVWNQVLRQYKDQVDPKVILTEDDLESQIGEMVKQWNSMKDEFLSAVAQKELYKNYVDLITLANILYKAGYENQIKSKIYEDICLKAAFFNYIKNKRLRVHMGKDYPPPPNNIIYVKQSFEKFWEKEFDFFDVDNTNVETLCKYSLNQEGCWRYYIQFFDKAGNILNELSDDIEEILELDVPLNTMAVIMVVGKDEEIKELKNVFELKDKETNLFLIIYGPDQ